MQTTEQPGRPDPYGIYWSCVAVFAALLIANCFQFYNHWQQRSFLRQGQATATTAVAQAGLVQTQLEPRLQAFSLDLIQLAATNDTARQIVRQFNIKWNPAEEGGAQPQ